MNKKVCYIAGPYSNPDPLEIERNILDAAVAMRDVITAGMVPLAPTLNSARFDWYMPELPVEYWYEATMELLKRCDAIWMFGDWQKSKGARAELEWALDNGMKVFYGGGNHAR